MDLGLEGRVALVTGGWRGTGAGIAAVLAAEGATVLVHGMASGQAEGTVAAITEAGGRAARRARRHPHRRRAPPTSWRRSPRSRTGSTSW